MIATWLFRVKYKQNKKIYKLFSMPVLKVKYKPFKTIYCLFGIIPIFYTDTVFWINRRYNRKILQLANKTEINIGFLIRENSKWSYGELYKKLKNNVRFNPIVLIIDEKHQVCNLEKNIEFFKNYNHRVIKDIKDFNKQQIDILFYEQPWFDFGGHFAPREISKQAITLYVPYGVEPDIYDSIMERCIQFYRNVYKSFIFSKQLTADFESYGITNTIPVGHPRLDAFKTKNYSKTGLWKSNTKTRIIYAPHHTFYDSLCRWATWEWNGKHILQLARNNQDTTEWVFKPHPKFKMALSQLLDSKEKAQKVFDDWAEVSSLYDSGDYFDIFETADIMISDCCSFKIEWLPTQKPFIQLLSHYENRLEYGKNTDYYSSTYYKANSVEDIDTFFNMLVKERLDPKKNDRLLLAQEIPLDATNKIYEFIMDIVK